MKNSSYLLEGNVPEGFSKIATHGAFWNVGFAAANKVVTLGGQLTLAWLLTPKDMGLAGMANAMAAFTAFLSAGSIGDVLIQRNKYSHEAGQGLWLSLFLSLATACLIALMSPFAALFGRGDLSGLLLVLVLPALAGFSNTILAAHLKHNLAFKNMAFTLFLEGMVYTTVTILLAWFGFGPYSLILSRVPSLLAGAGYMIFKTGWPPFEKPRWKSIQILFKPAFSLSVTGMLMGLQTQAPIFVVGLLLNSVMTGYFSWGWAVAGQAVYLLASNLRQVLLPVFVKMGTDPQRQGVAALRAARAMTAVLSIACGLQALWAKPILNFLLPAKWFPAEPVIIWVSLGLVFQGVWISATAWLNAVGKYRELFYSSILNVIAVAAPAALGAWLGSPEKAAMGSAIGMMVGSCVTLAYMPGKIVLEQVKPIVVPLVVTFMAWFILFFFLHQSTLLWLFLAGMAFIFIGSLVWWKQLVDIFQLFRRKGKPA